MLVGLQKGSIYLLQFFGEWAQISFLHFIDDTFDYPWAKSS
jgi:hypothetical protein